MPIEQRDSTTFLERVDFRGRADVRFTFGGFAAGKFVPNLNVSIWAWSGIERVFLNLNRRNIIASGQALTFSNGVVRFEATPIEHDLWYQDPNTLDLHWAIELLSPPAGNTWEWDIAHDGLVFLKQPGLTPEEIAAGGSQLEGTEGSHAVYATDPAGNRTRSNHYIANGAVYVRRKGPPGTRGHKELAVVWDRRRRGGLPERLAERLGRAPPPHADPRFIRRLDAGDTVSDWKGGKVAHLRRPVAFDSTPGQAISVPADMDIVADKLTVTVPQSFLDSAVYPVTVST